MGRGGRTGEGGGRPGVGIIWGPKEFEIMGLPRVSGPPKKFRILCLGTDPGRQKSSNFWFRILKRGVGELLIITHPPPF